MRILYTFGISLYTLGVRLAALFGHEKAAQMVRGWKHWREALTRLDKQRPTVWFHASSLGEFEQARPVIEAYKRRKPTHQVLLTFFSPSGYEVRSRYEGADAVCYLPPDTPHNARYLVEEVRPVAAYFVKYDFWFNMLGALHRASVPTFLFSAIFRPGQYFFRPWGVWFLRQLRECYTHLFVQNAESLKLLQQHGVGQCTLAGDTRFDRVHQIALAAEPDAVAERFLQKGKHVVVAGSSWEPDEAVLAEWLATRTDVQIVLAPHVIAEAHLKAIEVMYPRSLRYSALKAGADYEGCNVLIVDNIGILSRLYRYAEVAAIGGGFGKGIHNILEAVTFGKPVLFGPNYHKFQEAHDMIAEGGAVAYTNAAEFGCAANRWLDDAEAYAQAHAACEGYMLRNLGSTDIILDQTLACIKQ